MAENIADCLMLPAILSGNIAGKYFQQYAILVARLNVPLLETPFVTPRRFLFGKFVREPICS